MKIIVNFNRRLLGYKGNNKTLITLALYNSLIQKRMNKILLILLVVLFSFIYSLLWNQYRRPYCQIADGDIKEQLTEDTEKSNEIPVYDGLERVADSVSDEEEPVIVRRSDTEKDDTALKVQGAASEIRAPVKIFNIYFLPNSSRVIVTREVDNYLEILQEYLEYNSDMKLSLIGYSDNLGEFESNQKLSVERAEALEEVLISRGIEKGKLRISGRGETEPISDNDTERGRAINRRVSIRLLN